MELDIASYDGYIIATALRGPDFSFIHVRSGGNTVAHELKYIFTSRIRTICGANHGIIRLYHDINGCVEVVQYAVGHMDEYIVDPAAIQHYLHHIAEALSSLRSINAGFDDELLALETAARQLHYFFGMNYFEVDETIATLEALKKIV